MSIIIKAGLWVNKQKAFLGEFNLTKYINDLIAAIPAPPVGLTVTQVSNVSVSTTGWISVSGQFYKKTITNPIITASSIVDVIPVNASMVLVEAAILLPQAIVSEGAVTISAYNVPTANITVNLNIWK